MTIRRIVLVHCDVAGVECWYDDEPCMGEVGVSAREVMFEASNPPWHIANGKHVCPACWANGDRPRRSRSGGAA